MDAEALAVLAGNTLVVAAVTDTFEGVRHKVARLFGRGTPDAAMERRLDATRDQLVAGESGNAGAERERQAGQWATRFADLLSDHPEAAAELMSLVSEIQTAAPRQAGNVSNTVSGKVHGSVVMGRDFGDITIGGSRQPGIPTDE